MVNENVSAIFTYKSSLRIILSSVCLVYIDYASELVLFSLKVFHLWMFGMWESTTEDRTINWGLVTEQNPSQCSYSGPFWGIGAATEEKKQNKTGSFNLLTINENLIESKWKGRVTATGPWGRFASHSKSFRGSGELRTFTDTASVKLDSVVRAKRWD